jgi:hypothetical protein
MWQFSHSRNGDCAMVNRAIVAAVLLGLLGMSLACAEKKGDEAMRTEPMVNREFLLAHGFKQSPDDADFYELKHVRLADASRDLGFALTSLQPALNEVRINDVFTVEVRGLCFSVQSDVPYIKSLTDGLLDNPDTLCMVSVSLNQVPDREYLKTDSAPRLRIKSVAAPQDESKLLQITFEFAATGKKPVAALRGHFHVRVAEGDMPPNLCIAVSFPKGTPEVITVLPGKPMTFTVGVHTETIPAGRCILRVVNADMKPQPQRVDYQWLGVNRSDDYEFNIK